MDFGLLVTTESPVTVTAGTQTLNTERRIVAPGLWSIHPVSTWLSNTRHTVVIDGVTEWSFSVGNTTHGDATPPALPNVSQSATTSRSCHDTLGTRLRFDTLLPAHHVVVVDLEVDAETTETAYIPVNRRGLHIDVMSVDVWGVVAGNCGDAVFLGVEAGKEYAVTMRLMSPTGIMSAETTAGTVRFAEVAKGTSGCAAAPSSTAGWGWMLVLLGWVALSGRRRKAGVSRE